VRKRGRSVGIELATLELPEEIDESEDDTWMEEREN
jgi:hypothetical protein